MKVKTEITTRNWNNGWVDVNTRMPKEDDSCYILYKATLIDYDPKTLKSTNVRKIKGMGEADRENGIWTRIRSEYGCNSCFYYHGCDIDELMDWYYYWPLNGTPLDDSEGAYEVIDCDEFETNPNRLYLLSKHVYPKKRGVSNRDYMNSIDFEILAWCSIPDEPINPFEEENENAQGLQSR